MSIFAPPGDNVIDFVSFLQYVNGLTDVGYGGIFGLVLLIVIGGSLFFIMKAYTYDRAMSVSLFITSILAILFRILGLVTDYTLYVFLILLIVSLFLLHKESANGEI